MRAFAIEGLTTDDDVRWLAEQARHRRVIVEIGSFKGRSTRALADATPGVVYAIDNWNRNFGHFDAGARRACLENLSDLLGSKVHLLEHDSQTGLPPALVGQSVDMVWIDGDHGFDAVRTDIATYAPLVRHGGLVCGHDYSVWHPDVIRAVDAAYGQRVQALSIHRSIWWVKV